jgi:hypothetical protein
MPSRKKQLDKRLKPFPLRLDPALRAKLQALADAETDAVAVQKCFLPVALVVGARGWISSWSSTEGAARGGWGERTRRNRSR